MTATLMLRKGANVIRFTIEHHDVIVGEPGVYLVRNLDTDEVEFFEWDAMEDDTSALIQRAFEAADATW